MYIKSLSLGHHAFKVLLSTQMNQWEPVNYWEVTCDRLVSHPAVVAYHFIPKKPEISTGTAEPILTG